MAKGLPIETLTEVIKLILIEKKDFVSSDESNLMSHFVSFGQSSFIAKATKNNFQKDVSTTSATLSIE